MLVGGLLHPRMRRLWDSFAARAPAEMQLPSPPSFVEAPWHIGGCRARDLEHLYHGHHRGPCVRFWGCFCNRPLIADLV